MRRGPAEGHSQLDLALKKGSERAADSMAHFRVCSHTLAWLERSTTKHKECLFGKVDGRNDLDKLADRSVSAAGLTRPNAKPPQALASATFEMM